MLRNHPLRERVVEEMLLRRFPPLDPPVDLVQVIRLVAPSDRDAEAAAVRAMQRGDSIFGERDAAGMAEDGVQLLWEQHSEASTTTLLFPPGVVEAPYVAWIEGLAGEVVRAVRITLAADEAAAAPALARAAFASEDLVTCHVGRCRIWSDFRIAPDGYGRMVVAANGCAAADLGRLVQRLQELGNYRNLALLGLPLVQAHGPRLDALEARLSGHTLAIAEGEGQDEAMLDQLSDFSAELAHISAATAFRMSATRAYAAITADRLVALDVRPLTGHQSLADFTDRRLLPAVRTCANFTERLDALDRRAARVTALLRTRIETRIERQNSDLLESVERGIGLQIRLQHLVESLSVLAISYYAIGLIAYLAKGVAKELPAFPAELATAIAVLPVTTAIYLFISRRRHGLLAGDAAHDSA